MIKQDYADLSNALSAHENGLISDLELLVSFQAFTNALLLSMSEKEKAKADRRLP